MTKNQVNTKTMNTDPKSGYASVNGLDLYYEIHGTGEPLILLHGGVATIQMFEKILPILSQNRQVIAVELQAHGHTADIDRPFSYDLMADDIVALTKHLKINKADFMGYSLGGGVSLRITVRNSEVVKKLILVSTPFKRQGWYPEVLEGMKQMSNPQVAEQMKQTPLYQDYAGKAPKSEDWPVMLTKLSNLLRQEYDWSQDVATIKVPTLIVVGDADSIRTSHAVSFFELLGGGKADAGFDGSGMSTAQLAILPATTHYNIFSSPMLTAVVIPFLDAPRLGVK